MSRPDEPGAAKAALAPLIAEMKQKPVRMDFETASEWVMAGGAVLTGVAVMVALPALYDPSYKTAVRTLVLLMGGSGILILIAGLGLWVLGSLTTLSRYSTILSDSLDERFRMTASLAEQLAASETPKEIGKRLRHVRVEIRLAERMNLKVSAATAVVSGFVSLLPAIAAKEVATSLLETLALAGSGAGLGAVIAVALMHSFIDRLIRAEHVLAEAELMSGVRPKPRARFVHRRLQTRPG
ncbi:hypothetical protein D3C72_255970 [compost metagenome]